MLKRNPYEEHVAARLVDFTGVHTRWPRRLWGVGVVLLLKEIIEASEAVRDGVLSPEALGFLLKEAHVLIGRDPAIGDHQLRKYLGERLGGDLSFEGFDCRSVSTIIPDIEIGYLRRMAAVIADPERRPGEERAARMIASHMLDCGFSASYLTRWWWYRLRVEKEQRPLSTFLEEADQLCRRERRPYKVLVAFHAAPEETPQQWLSASNVASWLRDRNFHSSGIRQVGGMLLDVEALDPNAAVQLAAEQVNRMAARVAIGTRGQQLLAYEQAWVDGYGKPVHLRESRRVEVRALEREKKLLLTGGPSRVDAALELLGSLDDGPVGAAVAGGWAAVEALLAMPGDKRGKVLAGDRLASLVACSWPRAELTALSHRYAQKHASRVASEIQSVSENRDRAKILANAAADTEVTFDDAGDQAAWRRMLTVLSAPRERLLDVQTHVTNAIRRLYRQRNLVLHGGVTDGVALHASLRTAAPLIGAGFDRIAHAFFVEQVDPRELAVRARMRLETLGSTRSPSIVDLLEP